MNCPDASLIRIVEANLSLRADQEAVLAMVDAYSRDAMLYPVCRWFAELKQRRHGGWLSYL